MGTNNKISPVAGAAHPPCPWGCLTGNGGQGRPRGAVSCGDRGNGGRGAASSSERWIAVAFCAHPGAGRHPGMVCSWASLGPGSCDSALRPCRMCEGTHGLLPHRAGAVASTWSSSDILLRVFTLFFFFLFFGVHFFSCVGWTKEAITEKHRAMSLALPEVPGVGKQVPWPLRPQPAMLPCRCCKHQRRAFRLHAAISWQRPCSREGRSSVGAEPVPSSWQSPVAERKQLGVCGEGCWWSCPFWHPSSRLSAGFR